MKKADILIVGAGIVGLTAALSMLKRGFSVALFDAQSPDPKALNSRVYAINAASKKLFQSLNLWNLIDKKRLSPYQKMHIWDKANGEALDFDARMVASDELGLIMEESLLKEVLLSSVRNEKKVQIYFGKTIKEVNTEEQAIKISDGQDYWQGQLLMIVDGRHSPLRQTLQIDTFKEDYKQVALTATIETEKSHEKTAYQVFLKEGPLAFLPLPNTNQCSIVWSTSPEEALLLTDLEERTFNEKLRLAFDNKLGKTTLIGPRQTFPLMMQHVKQYVGNRWLLMGDAAHTIHPLAGLGLNLGLADLTDWLKRLDDHPSMAIYNSKILQAYQRQRKYAVWKVIFLMSGINQLFRSNQSPLVFLRGLGLKLGNQFTVFKRLLIEEARGPL